MWKTTEKCNSLIHFCKVVDMKQIKATSERFKNSPCPLLYILCNDVTKSHLITALFA